MSIAAITKDCRGRMNKTAEYFDHELRGMRTGRASTALIEFVKVDYYGSSTDLRDLAGINVVDATHLVVKPYDPAARQEIVKALETADLGLNPQIEGDSLRIAIPAPSSERRQQLIAQVKKMAEDSRVAIRNERRDANKHIDKLSKDKTNDVSEDDAKHGKVEIDSLTKSHIARIDTACDQKAKEIDSN